MTTERKLRVEEVALLTGVSSQTINTWYRWKTLHPEHELSQLLPKFEQESPHRPRFWKMSDIWMLTEFKTKLPRGRTGILGDVTQKHVRRRKQNEQNIVEN